MVSTQIARFDQEVLPLVETRSTQYAFAMASSEEIFREAVALPVDARAELTERLIASLDQDVDPEIRKLQLAEVRRRIEEVESGQAKLIPGDEVLDKVRRLLTDQ